MIDVGELLVPVAEDNVAGPDFSYHQERQEIESAFETARLSDIGEAQTPDWAGVIGLIEKQCAQTKDAWLAVYLARAGARAQRLDKVVTGCAYLAGLFETYWDHLHPSLEEYGFQGRKGPCESLVSIGEFIGPLRRVALIEHPRLGRFTCDDIERFATQGQAAENYGAFRAAIADLDPEQGAAIMQQLQDIRQSVSRVDAVLMANSNGDTGTNFALTYQTLDSIGRAFAMLTGLDSSPAGTADGIEAGENAAAEAPGITTQPAPGGTGRQIRSRSDVARALDSIIDYYSRQEPGSPIPVVLARVKSWVNMDFMSVLNDIAPSSLEDAKRVLTSRSDEG